MKATKPSAIVCQIVGRRHVSESNLQVIRYVVSRLRRKHATFAGMPRKDRRAFLRQVITAHQDNRAMYVAVMGGTR
jgi:hypothetical protein